MATLKTEKIVKIPRSNHLIHFILAKKSQENGVLDAEKKALLTMQLLLSKIPP